MGWLILILVLLIVGLVLYTFSQFGSADDREDQWWIPGRKSGPFYWRKQWMGSTKGKIEYEADKVEAELLELEDSEDDPIFSLSAEQMADIRKGLGDAAEGRIREFHADCIYNSADTVPDSSSNALHQWYFLELPGSGRTIQLHLKRSYSDLVSDSHIYTTPLPAELLIDFLDENKTKGEGEETDE